MMKRLIPSLRRFSEHAASDYKHSIACIGDSLTSGKGVREEQCYPEVLQEMLGTTYKVVNFGTPGACATTYEETELYNQLTSEKFDIIVAMLGHNDLQPCNWKQGHYAESYVNILKALQKKSAKDDCMFFICDPPKMFIDPECSGVKYHGELRNNLYTKVFPQVRDWHVVDLKNSMDKASYFYDGIHPNKEGCAIMARKVYDEIMEYEAPVAKFVFDH